jgi:cytoskeletal protein RodZ
LCGGDFYARAHIRSIANAVRADPAPLLALYDRADAGDDTRRGDFAADPVVREPVVRSRGDGPNWSAAMVVALVVVLAIGGYRVVVGVTDPAPRSPRRPKQSAAPPAPRRPASSPRGTPRPVPSDAVARGRRGVNVQLRADSGASWVSITNGGGRQLFQGLLRRGATKTVTDPAKVRLVVGNAGAVTLVSTARPSARPAGPVRWPGSSSGPTIPPPVDRLGTCSRQAGHASSVAVRVAHPPIG